MADDIADRIPSPPDQDERTMAVLAHALQVVGWWIAPLIIFLLKRDSKFVSFHALQALLLQICYFVLYMIFMVAWMCMIFATIATHSGHANSPPIFVFILFPLFWLFAMGGFILILFAAIVYAIKAGRGEWAGYPVIGSWAKRILKIHSPSLGG